jgi:hypothetical protein
MAELTIENTTVDFVVNTLMHPRWWESEEKYGITRVSLIQKQVCIISISTLQCATSPGRIGVLSCLDEHSSFSHWQLNFTFSLALWACPVFEKRQNQYWTS